MTLAVSFLQAASGGASETTRGLIAIAIGAVLLLWSLAALVKPTALTAMLGPGNLIRLYFEEAAWRARFFAAFIVLWGAMFVFLGLNMMLHFKFME